MVLSRLHFFRRGLTTAVFKEFGKVPERSEAFTSKNSASKPLSTLLKKDVGSVSREQVDDLRCGTISSKMLLSISSKTDIVTSFWKSPVSPMSVPPKRSQVAAPHKRPQVPAPHECPQVPAPPERPPEPAPPERSSDFINFPKKMSWGFICPWQ